MAIMRNIVDDNICLLLNGYGDRTLSVYKYNTLLMVKTKEPLITADFFKIVI
jgi:hypothetical protein